MSEKEKQELQDKIIKNLESDIKKVENTLGVMKEKLQYLKDIVWDRQSKMEREQMLKVLNGEKESTEVKSNIGNILVDSELTEKMKKKHLDNPNLRGMVTSEEFLSFPKVAKNVEAEYNPEYQGYNWKAKANDGSILNYGERDYGEGHRLLTAHSRTERGERGQPHRQINDLNFHNSANKDIIPQNQTQSQVNQESPQNEINGENVNRLLTNYSETEYGERQGRGEQGQLRREFNDRDFLRPAENIIPQNQNQSQANQESPQNPNFDTKNFKKLSVTEKLRVLENNQNYINNQKRASEILKEQNTQKQDNENLENSNNPNLNKNTNKRRHQ